MFEEKRKYFDYELAYNGFKRAEELFNKGGVEKLINDEKFDISGGGIDYVGTIQQWACNGYVPIIASAYNITLYLIDKNFDTNNKENDWYVSGEVDIYSYGGGDDSIFINDIGDIKDRIMNLINYAKINNYTLNDLYAEYDSLISVLKELNESEG